MKIGIFGSREDAQCKAVEDALHKRGVEVAMVESQGLNQGHRFCFENGRHTYEGQDLSSIGGWYLRHIMSPLPPSFLLDEAYYLYGDWFREYMHRRERAGCQLSFLLCELMRGVPMLNPPAHGSVVQYKPFQLQAALRAGLCIPDTVITNDPRDVRALIARVEEVVFKPSMGGGLCKVLDARAMQQLESVVKAPVTFQERVRGLPVRATIIGEVLVSCVGLPGPELDYRESEVYCSGKQRYTDERLPPELLNQTLAMMRSCGLLFSGVDFIKTADGRYVFLEANSSPIYLDIENKTGVPVTDTLVSYLLRLVNEPDWYRDELQRSRPDAELLAYALPFDPMHFV